MSRDRLGTVLDPYGRTTQCHEVALSHGCVHRLVLDQQNVAPYSCRLRGKNRCSIRSRRSDTQRGCQRLVQSIASQRLENDGLATYTSLELLRLEFRTRSHNDECRGPRTQPLVVLSAAGVNDEHFGVGAVHASEAVVR